MTDLSAAPASATLDIINEKGLHARASARFVETVEAHEASAKVSRDGQTVNGDSIMGLLMLGAAMGTSIEVVCTGKDAELLLAALSDLLADCFGEGK